MTENTIQQVREFYDQIGWSQVGDGLYQNARYEDLRPVAQEYIHKCHLRVNRYLDPKGEFFLDAGSGPVQWREYLTYSKNYKYRLCADLSLTALKEARQRLGDKGLYVVMDIAHLPFKADAFDGLVSMHTIHHLPAQDHKKAYAELVRVLKPGRRAVVVNGWSNPPLMRYADRLANLFKRLFSRKTKAWVVKQEVKPEAVEPAKAEEPVGTFVHKSNADWLREQLKDVTPIDIYCWRSVSTKFTRTYINEKAGGRGVLRFIYRLEELFPHFFGENGQYPIVSITKMNHGEKRR
jgi:ubiquinone/menaquinone biosynthesis C-methylase UbiE